MELSDRIRETIAKPLTHDELGALSYPGASMDQVLAVRVARLFQQVGWHSSKRDAIQLIHPSGYPPRADFMPVFVLREDTE